MWSNTFTKEKVSDEELSLGLGPRWGPWLVPDQDHDWYQTRTMTGTRPVSGLESGAGSGLGSGLGSWLKTRQECKLWSGLGVIQWKEIIIPLELFPNNSITEDGVTKKTPFIHILWINQALRICLEWSSEAIYFSTHQFKLIYHNLKKKCDQ